MSLSKDLANYKQERIVWQAALDQEGLFLPIPPSDQVRVRAKLYMARSLLRKQSQEILSPSDPDYGSSPFDAFIIRTEPDGLRLSLDPLAAAVKGLML